MPTENTNDAFWRAERAAATLYPSWPAYHPEHKAVLRNRLMALQAEENDGPKHEQLTDRERRVHDDAFLAIFEHAMVHNVPLTDGEECIAAGAAIANWIIASRNT